MPPKRILVLILVTGSMAKLGNAPNILPSGTTGGRAHLATARIAASRGASAPSGGGRRPGYNPVKAVGSFVPALTRKAFEKYGFSTAVLLMEWERIVGAGLARATVPERLKWPRGFETADAGDDTSGARSGATLVLRVDPARALDIEYQARQIVERINVFFGYRAVAEVRLLQAPLEHLSGRTEAVAVHSALVSPRQEAAKASPEVAAVPDETLRLALMRLERSVRGPSQGA